MARLQSINPSTGEAIADYDEADEAAVERALDRARHAFVQFRTTRFAERAVLMNRAADHLESRLDEHARLISDEMGKAITEARAEVKKCAWNCRYFAEHAARFLAHEPVASGAAESYVDYPPLGVVLAIMPWNFPYWQLFRFAAPALMAGNTAVLKHASNVPGCARAIERVFAESGFPEGAFTSLLIPGARAEALIDDPRIAAVTLTGSEAVGVRVARRAGGALKKAVLELGGSDPYIVLADADLDAAAATAVRARFQNAGQSCIAAKRFLVDKSVMAPFVERFVLGAKKLVVGDPKSDNTEMGPLARADLRDGLTAQVDKSVAMGAKVQTGGAPLPGRGFFFAPTVLTEVTRDMPVFAEETFGPVAAVMAVADAEEAIALANQSDYGLGANLWTRDLDKARALAPRIESGSVFVNGMVASDPRLPFGGVKKSGYGRELSWFGIREFTNIQTVWIGPAGDDKNPRSE